MSVQYGWRPDAYAATIAALTAGGAVGASSQVLTGPQLAQTLVGVAVNAELMAANAGVVPLIDAGTGEKGVVNIGLARDIIASPEKWARKPSANPDAVKTLYLAAHGAVRTTSALAKATNEALTISDVGDVGLIPVAVYLVLLGVAAMAATAYYATETHRERVRVDGENARSLALTDGALRLAQTELSATGQISPSTYALLGHMADAEASKSTALALPSWAFAAGGVVAIGGAAYATRRWW